MRRSIYARATMVAAFLVGATGETGQCLLKQLMDDPAFDKVTVFSRKAVEYDGEYKGKLANVLVEDFDHLENHSDSFNGCKFGFCTLGSTKAKAGSSAAFEKIDYGYTMKIAQLARKAGCEWFGVVTAVGANPNSSFLYPRVKGMIERDLSDMDFPCLAIFRPGFLLCDRKESRPLEAVGMIFAKGINWIAPNQIAISTEVVAKAMLQAAKNWIAKPSEEKQIETYENKQIAALAN